MYAFGQVLKGCLFSWEKKKTLSAKAKETISAKKGTAVACNVSHEIIVARASKCSQWKGFSKNQAVTTGP